MSIEPEKKLHNNDVLSLYSCYCSYEEIPSTLQNLEAKIVWQHIYKKKKEFNIKYSSYLSPLYLEGIKLLDIDPDNIPTLSHFNKVLSLYGWKALWIPGYVPGEVYASLLANSYFPIAKNIRSLSDIEYSPIPDFIHDVWGHLPLIFNEEYSQFLRFISLKLAEAEDNFLDNRLYLAQKNLAELQAAKININSTEYINAEAEIKEAISLINTNPSPKTLLSRMFLWTIEFGIINSSNNFYIIGAGILSSFGEALSIINRKVQFRNFDLSNVDYGFDYFSSKQQFVFISPSIKKYNEVLLEFLNKR
jgi:phenylalanine-4-hydroxylase